MLKEIRKYDKAIREDWEVERGETTHLTTQEWNRCHIIEREAKIYYSDNSVDLRVFDKDDPLDFEVISATYSHDEIEAFKAEGGTLEEFVDFTMDGIWDSVEARYLKLNDEEADLIREALKVKLMGRF